MRTIAAWLNARLPATGNIPRLTTQAALEWLVAQLGDGQVIATLPNSAHGNKSK
jgi:hypothetical protein